MPWVTAAQFLYGIVVIMIKNTYVYLFVFGEFFLEKLLTKMRVSVIITDVPFETS